MVKILNAIIEYDDKFVLRKVDSYDGWGGYESSPVATGDTKEELIQYCIDNNLDCSTSWPDYIIESPNLIKNTEKNKPTNTFNPTEEIILDFEPPIFMKAAMRIKDVVVFKDLADKIFNKHTLYMITDGDDIMIEGKELIKYVNAWLNGIRDPRSGIANYMGLVQDQLYYTLLNHVAHLYVNKKLFYLLPMSSNNEGLFRFHVIDPEKMRG